MVLKCICVEFKVFSNDANYFVLVDHWVDELVSINEVSNEHGQFVCLINVNNSTALCWVLFRGCSQLLCSINSLLVVVTVNLIKVMIYQIAAKAKHTEYIRKYYIARSSYCF